MSFAEDEIQPWLAELIARRRPGWSLEGPFYHHEAIYRLDVERIWRRGWLFAGHTCQIPHAGDYFTLEVDTDSLLVLRGDGGAIHAFHNICRHRGSLLCTQEQGHLRQIVCPYHQWVFGRDGRLLACRGMPEGIDRERLGLFPVSVRELEGLIYVCLADDPPDFEAAQQLLGPAARPQGFRRARVARIIDYEIAANWKLVWENNRECYHCTVNHPEYIRANFDHHGAEAPPSVQEGLKAAVARSQAKWAACGLAVAPRQAGMTLFPDPERGVWYSANRTPMAPGYVSESLDGRPVAPLMGDYPDADVGTLRMRTLPNFWNHSSCDHAVSTRLLPAGPQKTLARVLWLVQEDAVEGRDYHLEALLPFWQRTSEQDWELARNAQRGVNSRAYRPGPYSPSTEYNVEGFVRWYLRQLTGARATETAPAPTDP
jgi:Rieske 2Fe-2S family protein